MEVIKQFSVNDEVEAFFVLKREGLKGVGGWIPASILEVCGSGSRYMVETRNAVINREQMCVGASQIRPQPPPPNEDDENDRIFEEGQVVEILFYDVFWVPGKVWQVHHHHNVTAAGGMNKSISYSVYSEVGPSVGLPKNLGAVSSSKLRIRRQWVNGEWVPPPTQHLLPALHNKKNNPCFDIDTIRSGDSSSAVRRHSSSLRQRFKESSASENLQYSIGDDVEVCVDSINGWWRPGKVLDLPGDDKIKIVHGFWCWLTGFRGGLTTFYDMYQVRPFSPKTQEEDEKINYNLHQEVEVFHSMLNNGSFIDGSWVTGEVLEIYIEGDTAKTVYSILCPKVGIVCVGKEELRVHQEWVSQPRPSSLLYLEQQLLNLRLHTLSAGVRVEVYSFHRQGWVPATIGGMFGDQIEVYNKTNNCRLIVDASRVRPRQDTNKNQIFKENEAVEVQLDDGVWKKGEIWDVYGRGKNLFYIIKVITPYGMKICSVIELQCVPGLQPTFKCQLRARQKLVEEKLTDSSFKECFSSPPSLEIKMVDDDDDDDGGGVKDKMRSTSDWKSEDVQVYKYGAEVEIFMDDMGGSWRPGTIMKLQGDEIEVELERTSWQTHGDKKSIYNSSMIRPKPQAMDKETNQIFQLHDEVEAFDKYRQVWCIGHVMEVEIVTSIPLLDEVSYYVLHPTMGRLIGGKEDVRVQRNWINGRWIQSASWVYAQEQQVFREMKMDEKHHEVGTEVEVYSFIYYGWFTAIISKLCHNHIEVQINRIPEDVSQRRMMHVEASRIRPPPPPLQVEINIGDFIEVYNDIPRVWQKGEICGIQFKQEGIFCSVISCNRRWKVSKSKIRARQQYVDRKWVLHSSCRTSMLTTNSSKEDKCVSHNLSTQVGEQNNPLFPREVEMLDAIVDVDASSSIECKIAACNDREGIIRLFYTISEHEMIEGQNICRCNYCNRIYYAGKISRMIQHLIGEKKGRKTSCPKIPDDVQSQIKSHLEKLS